MMERVPWMDAQRELRQVRSSRDIRGNIAHLNAFGLK